ncbi:hypothetical protein [Elstera litoralis]
MTAPSVQASSPPERESPLRTLAPHLWPKGETELKARVVLALALLTLSKLSGVYVPILFKHAIDALSAKGVDG